MSADLVTRALAEAEAAEQEAAEAERRAVEDQAEPDLDTLVKTREAARVAALRVAAARDRAAAAAETARVAALEEVGRAVDQLAAEASAPVDITAGLQQIAEGRAKVLAAAAEHDQRVFDLNQQAGRLGAMPGQNGPVRQHAWIARAPDGTAIQHNGVNVAIIGLRAQRGIEIASGSGDVDAAAAHCNTVTHYPDRKHT